MISSDISELVYISDRVLVMCEGQIAKMLEKDEISEDSIIRHALEVN